MIRPARLLLALSGAALAVSAALPAEAAFSVSTGYPRREGTSRIFANATWDATAANVGFNRADCFDTKQTVLLFFTEVPAEATTVEIWARRDNTSCADPTQRAGTGATTPQCYKVASWTRDEVYSKQVSIKPIQVVQAIDKLTNVEDPASLDPATVCAKEASMPPTQVYLQVMAFSGTTVVGFTSGGTGAAGSEKIVALQTSYDIAGPNAPTGLTLGAGNKLLVANFSTTAQSTSDFKGYRAYCFPGTSSGSTAATKGTDAALEVLDDAAVDDTAVSDSGDDSASTATDASSTGERAADCPGGDPFVPGELPGPEIEKYACGESSTLTGEMKIDGLMNGVPYAVAIGTTDRQGNSGPLSTVACAMPKETDDFYNVYRRAGGTAGGGWCAIGSGAAAPFGVAGAAFALALAARFARRARPRR